MSSIRRNLTFFVYLNGILLSQQVIFTYQSSERNDSSAYSFISIYNATTNGIKYIFIGRCSYFLNVLHKRNCEIDPSKYDCLEIWNEFHNAIVGKEPCSIKLDDFNKFFSLTNHPIPENKTLFWHGTDSVSHQCK